MSGACILSFSPARSLVKTLNESEALGDCHLDRQLFIQRASLEFELDRMSFRQVGRGARPQGRSEDCFPWGEGILPKREPITIGLEAQRRQRFTMGRLQLLLADFDRIALRRLKGGGVT